MNKPNKCKNCQWYGKPYWSIINPCDNCPNENDNMTIVQIDGVPVFKETLTEEQVIPDINSLQVDNAREQAKLYYEANKEEIWANTLREKDKEVEVILKKLEDNANKHLTNQLKYCREYQDYVLLNYIKNKDKEIDRLNNTINELEKGVSETIKQLELLKYIDKYKFTYDKEFQKAIDKLKELKEGNKE